MDARVKMSFCGLPLLSSVLCTEYRVILVTRDPLSAPSILGQSEVFTSLEGTAFLSLGPGK